MNCLKCGRETALERAFCDDCLAEMEKYPVSFNASVTLPKRTSSPAQKKAPRRRTVSPEEQISVLKNRIRLLWILLIAVSILSALLAYPAISYLQDDHFLPGQNYTSIVSKTSESDADPEN